MNDNFVDFYALLGIQQHATTAEIDRAYRAKVAEAHPDKNPDDAGAVEVTRLLHEARATLKDTMKRVVYDGALHRYHAGVQETKGGDRRAQPARSAGRTPPSKTTKPVVWSPSPPSPRRATGGVGLGLGLLAAALGGAYLYSKKNNYDRSVERYRGRDGTFRSGPFS